MDKQSRDYVICLCCKTTRGEVEDYIRSHEVADMKDLCEQMNIGKKCGGCREDLQMVLDELAAEV
ncbi:MAG: (2Fe-2S)-binding protein [Eubacterium sp.]|nr:(2Fe-2S)-binding protein [Eubacterium sp.]